MTSENAILEHLTDLVSDDFVYHRGEEQSINW